MPVQTLIRALAALLLGGLVVLGPSVAQAQDECYPPPCTAGISDSTVESGEEVTASSGESSFTPGERVEFGVESVYQRLGEVKANANGEAVATFGTPTNLENGAHDVVFTSILTGKQVRVPFTLIAAPDGQSGGWRDLTGGLGLAALGLAGALIGGLATGLLLAQRQRRRLAELRERLRQAALHDPLTGLPTRALLHDRIESALRQRIQAADSGVAVLRFDLGRFKAVNEVLGHDVADQVLVEVARRLESVVRPGDTVARLGGDQFALVLPDVDLGHAVGVSDRIARVLALQVNLDTVHVAPAGSIGIALSDGSQDGTGLLEQADRSLREAKLHAPGRHQVFSDDLPAPAGAEMPRELVAARAAGGCTWTTDKPDPA